MEKYLRILGIGEGKFYWILIHTENGVDKISKPKEEQDEMIKNGYDEQRKIIELEYTQKLEQIESDINLDNENKLKYKEIALNEYRTRINKLEEAYSSMRTSALRTITQFKDNILKAKDIRNLNFQTEYKNFGFSEEYINSLSPQWANDIISSRYSEIMQAINEALLDNSISGEQRNDIEAMQKSCKNAYKYIANPIIRKKYAEYLDNKELEKKYSKKSQFDPELIFSDSEGKYHIISKNSDNPEEIFLNNNMSIKKFSTLAFRNASGVINSYINKFEIKRKVNNKEIIDYIYSDIHLRQLEQDEETGKPINSEYYNCVVNQLLSDEMIKASKFNSGYIGLVERFKNDNGEINYRTTLQDKKLHQTEQEYLAAIMIFEQSQRNEKDSSIENSNNQQESVEGR